ncbi:MAG: pectate lyase [Lachnospiraceae bacterium]|nr:pectate lyase [Lachnospiraceae bacterium]
MKRNKFYFMAFLFVLGICSFVFYKKGVTSEASSISWNFKDSDFKNLGKITSNKTINNLTLLANSSKYMNVNANTQTLDGNTFKYCLSLNGMGTTSYRSVKVPVSKNSRVKVTLMSNSNDTRYLAVADSNGKELASLAASKSISMQTYDYTSESGYIYLYSKNSGINIFKIQVDYKDDASSNNSNNNNDSSSNDSSSDYSGENSGKTLTITDTIKVEAGQTYDGKGIKIVASGMGDGSQAEDQKPIFRLENGASLKNVIIGAPGCDGVHCYGNNTITNVVWEDVGEDALTVKGGANADAGTVTINGGSAQYASDKIFQLNAPVTFVVNNFSAYDMGKLIRQNGKTTFTTNVYLNNVTVNKVGSCIAMSDSTSSKLYYKNLTVSNCKTWFNYPNSSQVINQSSSSSNSSDSSSSSSSDSSVPSGYTVVAADNSGDYTSLAKAINAGKTKIYVKSGTYKEVVTIDSSKSGITIKGQDKSNTIISYDNYSAKSNGNGGTYGTGGSASFFVKGNNITIENITIENSYQETGTNGDQAVALYASGTKNIFKNCSITGNQDTLCLYGGTQYFEKCYIAGDVDFIFGNSQAFFESCEIRSLNRGSSSNNGYITAASTYADKTYGFVFNNCSLTADSSMKSKTVYLGRPWCPSGTSTNKAAVAFINCSMGAHIKDDPWTSMSGVSPSHGRFYEYNSSGTGAVVNSNRPQLSSSQASSYTRSNVVGF